MKLIDPDVLYEAVEDHVATVSVCPTADWARGKTEMKKICLEEIRNAPIIDASPVRHGHWVYVGEIHKDNSCCAQWDCSECGSPQTFFGCNPFYRYCPICGAKMDGGAENVSC